MFSSPMPQNRNDLSELVPSQIMGAPQTLAELELEARMALQASLTFHFVSLMSPALLSQPAAAVREERARRPRMGLRWVLVWERGC